MPQPLLGRGGNAAKTYLALSPVHEQQSDFGFPVDSDLGPLGLGLGPAWVGLTQPGAREISDLDLQVLRRSTNQINLLSVV